MKINFNWKSLLPDFIIFAIFVVASVVYFSPALEGKVIFATDNVNFLSMVHETSEYVAQTGESPYWTNAMFSGMPTYQIGGNRYAWGKAYGPLIKFFRWGERNALFLMLFYLIAFYVLLRSFKIDKWVSMAGAFAITLSSYFFIIIAASHISKAEALTWMTLVLVGFLLCYRRQYFLGAILIMFFIPLGFFKHLQMSYYVCMLIGVLFFAELYNAFKSKQWKQFGIATAVFIAAFAVGLGIGGADFFANQEYAKETMRGGHSDIVRTDDANQTANKNSGLSLEYATQWSYGIDETLTLLVPNYMGGASGYKLDTDSELYKSLTHAGVPAQSAKQFVQHAPTYWGTQPFTSGPVYVGAIVCFLFVLGLLIVPGPYKWALLIATLFSVLLSWGHNFMPFTELFFKYFPMYSKFRAVSSILVVAEITMPLLALLAVKEIIDRKTADTKPRLSTTTAIYISAGITAGLCLVLALFGGSIFSFSSPQDAAMQLPDFALDALIAQRAAMLKADAWRSCLFIVAAAALVWAYNRFKFNTTWLGIALAALVIADMWPVAKRFCNDDNFVTVKQRDKTFAMQPYEKEILKDNSYFRVLNLSTNTFNDARTGHYLHSIGGYHAAKLRRYQDLIDEHLQRNNLNWDVVNMLNGKYIILPTQNAQPQAQLNPRAMGAAWFVDTLLVVDNANQESDALREIDLHTTAVLDRQFEQYASLTATPHDNSATVELQEYRPNRLTYNSKSSVDKTLVFSEIYYPYGWVARVDGKPVDIFRVNYVLRAINLPAGEHSIVLSFEPQSVKKGNTISIVCMLIMLLTIIGYIVSYLRPRPKNI